MSTTDIDLATCRTLEDFLGLAGDGHAPPDRAREVLSAADRHLHREPALDFAGTLALAEAVERTLGDRAWSGRLLEEAGARAASAPQFVALADAHRRFGEEAQATRLLHRAAATSGGIEPCLALMQELRARGCCGDELRHLYISCFEGLREPAQQLRWVEGVLELFEDPDWARRVYAELAGELHDPADQERLLRSFEQHYHRPLQ